MNLKMGDTDTSSTISFICEDLIPFLKMLAKVARITLSVLVDSGSIHNFICEDLIPFLRLNIWKKSGPRIYVANGGKVTSMRICKFGPFFVAQERFQTNFYIILLGGFDEILGVKWLCTLNPILWDFSSLKIEFTVNGKKAEWTGKGHIYL